MDLRSVRLFPFHRLLGFTRPTRSLNFLSILIFSTSCVVSSDHVSSCRFFAISLLVCLVPTITVSLFNVSLVWLLSFRFPLPFFILTLSFFVLSPFVVPLHFKGPFSTSHPPPPFHFLVPFRHSSPLQTILSSTSSTSIHTPPVSLHPPAPVPT